jgi:hypothetical protein
VHRRDDVGGVVEEDIEDVVAFVLPISEPGAPMMRTFSGTWLARSVQATAPLFRPK